MAEEQLNFCQACGIKRVRDVKQQLENLFLSSKTLFKPELCAICFKTLKTSRKRTHLARRANKHEQKVVKQKLKEEELDFVHPPDDEDNSDDETKLPASSDEDYDPPDDGVHQFKRLRNVSDDSDSEKIDNTTENTKYKPGQKVGLQEVITDLDPKVLEFVDESDDPKQSFKCKVCEKKFAYANAFCQHLSSHPGVDSIDKPFKCNLCEARFSRRFNLKTHRRSHSDDRPFKCSYPPCTAAFKDKHTMASHETMHTGSEKPHVCEFCSKAFRKRTVLETHKRTHTGDRPFMCKFCGFCSSQKQNLVTHERQHTKERPFRCKVCNKGFFQMIQLQRHEMDHTGDRPYVCEICGHSCKAKSYLKQHMDIHRTERPHKCDRCDFTSKRKENIRSHMKVHIAEKTFQCSHCSKMFKHKDSLKKHERRHFREPGGYVQGHLQRQRKAKPVAPAAVHVPDGKPSQRLHGHGGQATCTPDTRNLKAPCDSRTIEHNPNMERFNPQDNRMLIPHQGYSSSSYSTMGMLPPHHHVTPHTVIQTSAHEYEPVDVVFNIL